LPCGALKHLDHEQAFLDIGFAGLRGARCNREGENKSLTSGFEDFRLQDISGGKTKIGVGMI
jgi:hypothetical protein